MESSTRRHPQHGVIGGPARAFDSDAVNARLSRRESTAQLALRLCRLVKVANETGQFPLPLYVRPFGTPPPHKSTAVSPVRDASGSRPEGMTADNETN
jgi:hypothetical protein